jgi:GT2 family glycosyltransferase
MQRADAVDVVMPVYNAPELTRRAIDSVFAALGARVSELVAWDDASDAPTRELLDSLQHPRLRVVHAERNTGFGEAVNRAVASTRTPLVLVLNSDVEASGDFLAPLLDAMARDPRLASISPAGNSFASYDLERYRRAHGYVTAYALAGYAFLLRRAAFDEVGGFDRTFGRGYYEDTDLARRLLAKHWNLGIHPGSQLYHRVHGSFEDVADLRGLREQNRRIYLERWPAAGRHVLLATGGEGLAGLPAALRAELEEVLRAGGEVEWLHTGRPPELIAFPMRSARLHLLGALARVSRRQRRGRAFSELWLTDACPALASFALARLARRHGSAVRHCGRSPTC